jgi:hypothetical protein
MVGVPAGVHILESREERRPVQKWVLPVDGIEKAFNKDGSFMKRRERYRTIRRMTPSSVVSVVSVRIARLGTEARAMFHKEFSKREATRRPKILGVRRIIERDEPNNVSQRF